MSARSIVFLSALLGAAVAGLGRFGYAWAALASKGVHPADVPLFQLAIEVMEVHWFALGGAAAGGGVGAVVALVRFGLGHRRRTPDALEEGDRYRAHEIIQADRTARADAYLAQRRAEKEASNA